MIRWMTNHIRFYFESIIQFINSLTFQHHLRPPSLINIDLIDESILIVFDEFEMTCDENGFDFFSSLGCDVGTFEMTYLI